MNPSVRPMTEEEAAQAVFAMRKSMDKGGWWNKVCNNCSCSVGGRLAEYGRPTEQDLRYLACPHCGNDGKGFRIEFVPGATA